MIEKWEILPSPNEEYPRRYRVNVSAGEEELAPLFKLFQEKAGKPWVPRLGSYKLSFYFYDLTDDDRRTVENFFKNSDLPAELPQAAPPAPTAFTWPEAPAPTSPPEMPSLVEPTSPLPPLSGVFSRPSAPEPAPEPPSVYNTLAESTPDPAPPPPKDQPFALLLSDGQPPAMEPGRIMIKMAYVVPQDTAFLGDQIHNLLVQTVESRKMPFVFHRLFVFTYRWMDKDAETALMEACQRQGVDCLICVGDEKQLHPLSERAAERKIPFHVLSRDDARKQYWRLGLITRIVLKEE